ncbi:MAG: TonB-dependent receptor [Bacteroidia bacterium]|nr:TonB-dependent receptor [Bacteroidia bacterium]
MKKIALFILFTHLLNTGIAQQQDSIQNKLNEIIISANKFEEKLKDIPRQVDIITAKKIAQLNKQTTADLLQETGNIYIQKSQQGGGSLLMRGFESNRVLLVVDGVRLNNAIYRGGHLQNVLRIDQQMLDRIEIIYGPGSLMYGSDALGGVVHLITKKPKLNQSVNGTFNSRFGTVNNEFTNSISLGSGFRKWAWLAHITSSTFGDLHQGKNRDRAIGALGERKIYQGRVGDTDRILNNENPSLQIGSAYKQVDGLIKLFIQTQPYQTHQINLQFSTTNNVPRYDRLSELTNDTPTFAQWYYGPELRTLASYQFEDSKARKWHDRLRITAAFQYIEESRNTRIFNKNNSNNNSNYLNKRFENVYVGTLNLDVFKNTNRHEIRYGAELTYNKVNSNAYAMNILTHVNKPISTRYPDGGSHIQTLAVYLSHTKEFNSKFILSEGLRLSSISLESNFVDKTFYSFLPNQSKQRNTALCGSLGLVYLLSKDIKLYANTANAYRAPNVDDMNKLFDSKKGSTIIIPNNNLKPEQSWTSEIGTNIVFAKKLAFEANVYYTHLWNAIIVAPTQVNGQDSTLYDNVITAVSSNQNRQTAFIYGYQLNLTCSLLKYLVIQAGINYTYGRIKADSIMPLDHIPPAFGRISLSYTKERWQTSIYSLWSAGKMLKDYYLNGEDNQQYATANGMPGWYIINLQGSYVIDKKSNLILQTGIENILDTNYRTFASGISAAGRNIWLSLRMKF